MPDVSLIERIIEDGRTQELPSAAIAEQVIALIEDPRWAKALSHPVRGSILRLLRSEEKISPARAAQHIDATLGAIAYHFRRLQKLGLIEVCEHVQRRGVVEHIYCLTPVQTRAVMPVTRSVELMLERSRISAKIDSAPRNETT